MEAHVCGNSWTAVATWELDRSQNGKTTVDDLRQYDKPTTSLPVNSKIIFEAHIAGVTAVEYQ
jgi:hypothetical protein